MEATQRETWRAIPGFTRYEVSNLGRVRSWIPWNGHPVPRLMRPALDTGGYPSLTILDNDDRRCTRNVHVLLALAYLGPRPEDTEIRHLDGDSKNCTLGNLAYGTRSENAADRVRHGTHHNAKKTHCHRGHELAGDNVFTDGRGMRQCRDCKNAHARRYRAEKAAGKMEQSA